MSEKMELAVVELIKNERFYSELIMRMKRIPDKTILTLKVKVTHTGIELRYYPTCYEQFQLSQDLRSGVGAAATVLKHELEHIMRHHTQRRKTLKPELFNDTKFDTNSEYKDKCSTIKMLNMAEDYAINEILPNLPDSINVYDENDNLQLNPDGTPVEYVLCKVPLLQKENPKLNILRNQTMEYYFEILNKINKSGKDPSKTNEGLTVATLDDHDGLDSSSEELDPEVAKDIIKQLVNEAFEGMPNNLKGSIPNHVLTLIKQLNEKTKDWRKDLRQFRESCVSVTQEETRRRRNRRYGLLYPGRRSKPKLHLVTVIDSSGSVWDEALNQLFTEIKAMSKLGITITVVECDSIVQNSYVYDPRIEVKVKGRGGTAFNPAFEFIASKEFKKEFGSPDGIVYLTDGENYDSKEVKKPKCKVLWALLPGCKVEYEWGNKTWIEVSNDKRNY